MGHGWCRPKCHYFPDGYVLPRSCRLNSYMKESSNPEECKSACENEPECTGFAISNSRFYYSNRCYIYGNFSSTNGAFSSNWIARPHSYYEVNSTNGNVGIECYKNVKEEVEIKSNYLFYKLYFDIFILIRP